MYVLKFLGSLHFFSAVLVPFFLDYGKISFAQIMILQSWFAFWAFALEVPTGTIADKFGRKTSLILSAVMFGLGAAVYVAYANIWLFFLAEFLFALSISLRSGADDAMIYDSLKMTGEEDRAKKIFANIYSLHMVALSVSAVIGGGIASVFGVRWSMGAAVFSALGAFIVALTLKEPKIKAKGEEKFFSAIFQGAKYLKNHKILRILALDSSLVAALAFFIIWTYQLKLGELNLDIGWFGLVHAGLAGAQVIVMQGFGMLEKKAGSKKGYLLFSALIAGAFFIVLAFSQNLWLAITAMFVIAGFGITRERYYAAFLNRHIESHNRATVLSCIVMIKTLVRTIIYPIIGFAVEYSLSYVFIGIGAGIIALALFSRVEESHLVD